MSNMSLANPRTGRTGESSGTKRVKNLIIDETLFHQGVQTPSPLSVSHKDANIYYVDNTNGSLTFDGKTKARPFKYLEQAIDAVNANDDGKGATIYVAPGLYLENDAQTLSANDVRIIAMGLPEDTVIFFSGTQGSVVAATDDGLTITGGNNLLYGLGLYTHVATKSAVVLDGDGGGYNGGFNRIENCLFSPQAVDGQKYGIYMKGGAGNQIINNRFYATATAGIYVYSGTHNSTRTEILGNKFFGCGDAGILVNAATHQMVIDRNIFQTGSESGYNMTDDISITSGMTGGSIHIVDNYASVTTFTDFVADAKTGGTVRIFNNHYTQDT